MTDEKKPANVRPLERYRSYLQLLARSRLRFLPGDLDASDIVQDVMLKAHARQGQFRGHSEGEWMAWLRRILANTVTDAVRDPANKLIIRAAVEKSSMRMDSWLAAEHTSPSGKAQREERLLQLADAMASLPEDERIALELRFMHEQPLTLAQISEYLGRGSAKAVAGLLARGLKRIRSVLSETT